MKQRNEETAKKNINDALKTLGVKGMVKVIHISFNTYRVLVDDKYFGIFDDDKNTFVD